MSIYKTSRYAICHFHGDEQPVLRGTPEASITILRFNSKLIIFKANIF